MVDREEFRLPSSDEVSQLYCVSWAPHGKALATLQISHGMIEHVGRYEEFACRLAEQGIAVVGHDQLGHGKTCKSREDFGFFAERDGGACVVKDMHRVNARICRMYPGIPHFMLGHSMGSFYLRRYITMYGHETDGAILMGTGGQRLWMLVTGLLIVRMIRKLKGARYISPVMHRLVLGSFNRFFEPADTAFDWLTRDAEQVGKYQGDPLCNFGFTCSAYEDILEIMLDLKLKKNFNLIPKGLPILVVSGEEDPVGEFGRGVRRVYRQFVKLEMKDVMMKLWHGSRHELLNEIDRECVYEYIAGWITAHVHRRDSLICRCPGQSNGSIE